MNTHLTCKDVCRLIEALDAAGCVFSFSFHLTPSGGRFQAVGGIVVDVSSPGFATFSYEGGTMPPVQCVGENWHTDLAAIVHARQEKVRAIQAQK